MSEKEPTTVVVETDPGDETEEPEEEVVEEASDEGAERHMVAVVDEEL